MATAEVDLLPTGDIAVATGPALRMWALALATYGVGDGITTAMIVWATPLYREANPILNVAIDAFGGSGLVGTKLLAIAICVTISISGYRSDDQFIRYLPPVALALVGTATTLVNLSLLW